MKKILISLLALCAGIAASAEVVSRSEAEAVAKKHFASSKVTLVWDGTEMMTKASSGEPSFYVFNNSDGGWAIIAGDNCSEPILGYSADGSFSSGNIPCNLKNWMAGVSANIEKARSAKATPHSSIRSKWNEVGQTTKATTQKHLTTASWGQDSPYNDQCPTYSGSKKAATGCVATAMAIVLRYNKWPEQGKGTIPAYTTGTKKINVTAKNIDGYKYDWDNMPLKYSSSASSTQKTAVANLMAQLGAMVEMDYDEESGAYSSDIVPALSTYMSYGANAVELYRANYSNTEWYNMIKAEIDANRPIIYGGQDINNDGGHQFVCDGYDSDGKIHINWGWDGEDEGWFAVSYLGDKAKVGYIFSYYDSAIFGLAADKSGTSKDGYDLSLMSNDKVSEAGIMLASGTVGKGSSFALNVKYIINAYGSAISSKVKFGLLNKDGELKEYISSEKNISISAATSESYGSTSLSNIACTITKDIAMGDYISLFYTDCNGNWLRMPGWNIKDTLESSYTSFCVDRFGVYDIAFINVPDNLATGNLLYFDLIPGQRLISDISWYYDGTANTKGYATVASGTHTIKAVVKYKDGGSETIQKVIKK